MTSPKDFYFSIERREADSWEDIEKFKNIDAGYNRMRDLSKRSPQCYRLIDSQGKVWAKIDESIDPKTRKNTTQHESSSNNRDPEREYINPHDRNYLSKLIRTFPAPREAAPIPNNYDQKIWTDLRNREIRSKLSFLFLHRARINWKKKEDEKSDLEYLNKEISRAYLLLPQDKRKEWKKEYIQSRQRNGLYRKDLKNTYQTKEDPKRLDAKAEYLADTAKNEDRSKEHKEYERDKIRSGLILMWLVAVIVKALELMLATTKWLIGWTTQSPLPYAYSLLITSALTGAILILLPIAIQKINKLQKRAIQKIKKLQERAIQKILKLQERDIQEIKMWSNKKKRRRKN